MEIHVLFCVLVLAAVLFPFPSSTAQPPKIDYYQVAFQWPGSLCIRAPNICVPNPPKRFTLHGLWPDSSAAPTTPTNCLPHVAFAAPSLAQTPHLQKIWPSILTSKNNHEFWKHEWEKHGRCAAPLDQNQFFDLAIKLYGQININGWLAKGLRSKPMKTLEVTAVILAELKVRPILNFQLDANRDRYLKEVIICSDGKKNIHCPSTRPNSHDCPQQPGGCSYYLP